MTGAQLFVGTDQLTSFWYIWLHHLECHVHWLLFFDGVGVPCQMLFESPDKQDLLRYCCRCQMWLGQKNRAGLSWSWSHACCESPIRLFISKCVISLLLTNLSMVLQTTKARLIGLQFPGSWLFNFLWIAVTFADFQSSGIIIPVSTELLKYVFERSTKFGL